MGQNPDGSHGSGSNYIDSLSTLLRFFLMLTISFFIVVFPVTLHSTVLVASTKVSGSCNPFFGECSAILTLNAALGDPNDGQANINLPRVFTITDGWSNAIEDTCLRCQWEWSLRVLSSGPLVHKPSTLVTRPLPRSIY